MQIIKGGGILMREKKDICEGTVYHITSRGNNKDYILSDPKHKAFLLKQIKEYNTKFDFELLAYVIMDNHYHLLIKINKTPISEIMFNINNVLSKYLVRELNRKGHVLEKRYTCKIVATDTYIVWLLRYIHRNPIRAHMCNDLDDYRWSSHYFYKRGYNSFINTDYILNILSPKKAAAQMLYLELVNWTGTETDKISDMNELKCKYHLTDTPLSIGQLETPNMQKQRKSLDDIFEFLNLKPEIKILITSGSKKHSITGYKIKFIVEALNNKYTFNEIASFLNISKSSISMLLSRHKKENTS